jgi:molybdenum cofactor biosynthesis protein MoaC
MVNITHKPKSLRRAIAQAIVQVSKQETIDALVNKTVPKGDVFEMAKTAGLFAAKRTSDMIPDCHPIPVEYTKVWYEIDGLTITIKMEVHAIYRTGVEVEAMHGASVVALTMYDMLKPIDKGIEIQNIKLVEKKGGKTDFRNLLSQPISAAVIVCSDTISAGKKEDRAGKVIMEKLKKLEIAVADYSIIPDEVSDIQKLVSAHVAKGTRLIILTGGTGLSKRDITPEAILPLLDREVSGIAETIRNYGQERTPYAMLSRSVAGFIGETLVLALPGSTKGAEESMDAIFPAILHIFKVAEGAPHTGQM